jgi:hypothetical protein
MEVLLIIVIAVVAVLGAVALGEYTEKKYKLPPEPQPRTAEIQKTKNTIMMSYEFAEKLRKKG